MRDLFNRGHGQGQRRQAPGLRGVAPGGDAQHAGHRRPRVLDRFMPWSEAVPDSCRMTPAQAARAAEMPDDPILNVDPEAFDED